MSERNAGEEPARFPKRRRVRHGLVIVNTGEGKGKTTAALGVIFRAWGRDFRVRMFQFRLWRAQVQRPARVNTFVLSLSKDSSPRIQRVLR